MRTCSRCKLSKADEDFFRRGGDRPSDARQSTCGACIAAYKVAWRAAHRVGPPRFVRAPEGMKHCKRCDRIKALDEFHRRADRPIGRVAYCKPCWIGLRCAFGATPHGRLLGRLWKARARAIRAGVVVEEPDYIAIYERDQGVCWICGRHLTFDEAEGDHVIPLARGGPHTERNIRVACKSCNSRKHKRLLAPTERDAIGAAVRSASH